METVQNVNEADVISALCSCELSKNRIFAALKKIMQNF